MVFELFFLLLFISNCAAIKHSSSGPCSCIPGNHWNVFMFYCDSSFFWADLSFLSTWYKFKTVLGPMEVVGFFFGLFDWKIKNLKSREAQPLQANKSLHSINTQDSCSPNLSFRFQTFVNMWNVLLNFITHCNIATERIYAAEEMQYHCPVL